MKSEYNSKSCIYEGRVFHSRKSPKNHNFKYHVFYLHINLNDINKKSQSKLLSFNKFNIFSFYDKDHGPSDCKNINKWVKNLLKKNDIKYNIKSIYLLTYPRILGYVFNPLSVFTCLDNKGKVVVQIYEVHNTFKQRYFYIVENSFNKLNHENVYKKEFHVSPFMSMAGNYKFKSYMKNNNINIFIKYSSKKESFIASFTGKEKELCNVNLLYYFLKIPFMTLKIIVGIHYEAIILYLKGVKYFKCPKPKSTNFIKYFRKDKCG